MMESGNEIFELRIPFEIFELIFHLRFFQIHFRNEIFSGIETEIEKANRLGIYLVELSSWNLDVNSELIIRGFWFYAIEIELEL